MGTAPLLRLRAPAAAVEGVPPLAAHAARLRRCPLVLPQHISAEAAGDEDEDQVVEIDVGNDSQ